MIDKQSALSVPRPAALVPVLALVLMLGLTLLAAMAPLSAAAQKGSGAKSQKGAVDPGPVDSTVRVKPFGLKSGRAPIMSTVTAGGSVSPWRPGQRVQVWFFHDGKRFEIRRLRLKKGSGNYGTFRSSIITKEGGKYAVRAKYFGTAGPDPVHGSSSAHKSWKVSYRSIARGECGRVVRGFRRALNRIGAVPGGGQCFNGKMARAVLAYRKLNRMSRNAIASKSVVKRVFSNKGRYRVRRPELGRHVEAPLDKQVIVFANGDKPYAIFPIASGKASTPTILGTYSFYMKTPGMNSHGMYYSSYFIRGYAIHGYADVPDYPASHGCLRTFIADQPRIYDMTEIGMPIYTFGNAFRSLAGGEQWSTAGDLGPDLGPTGGLDPAR